MKKRGGKKPRRLNRQLVVLVILVVGVIFSGFYYVQHHQPAPTLTKLPTLALDQTNADSLASQPQVYHDTDGRFSLSYPGGWQITTTKTGSGVDLINVTTLTSPSANISLYVKYQRTFISSDCIPDFYDQPFQTTNRCFSSEYLSADALPVIAYQQSGSSLLTTQWYLAHYHYETITINAKELYETCLVIGQPAVGKPKMGFELDHPVSQILGSDGSDQGYFSACVEVGSQPDAYAKPEVQTGEAILRSFRLSDE